jgi:LTXXQ motif family protein
MLVKRALTTNLCRRANAFITPSSFEIHLGSRQLYCGTRKGIVMKRTLVAALVAGSLFAPIFALAAEGDQQASRAERMQHWEADRETVLDAKLAGMKAGLGLTTDQEKLWGPFESAVKDADKSHLEAMGRMIRMREQSERMSPVDRLEAMSDRLSQGATNVKKIAGAAKPLYDSLDETQKHKFGMLGRMLMPERSRFAMDMMHHQMGERDHDGDE